MRSFSDTDINLTDYCFLLAGSSYASASLTRTQTTKRILIQVYWLNQTAYLMLPSSGFSKNLKISEVSSSKDNLISPTLVSARKYIPFEIEKYIILTSACDLT